MENLQNHWQFGDELRVKSKVSEDHMWHMAASKLAEQTRSKGERFHNLDFSKCPAEVMPRETIMYQEDSRFENLSFSMLNLEPRVLDTIGKSPFKDGMYNMNTMYPKSYGNSPGNLNVNMYAGNNQHAKDLPNKYKNNDTSSNNSTDTLDRRFKTLPAAETLPKHETLGGYIFVCNNDTMQEDLKRQLFGLPPRYRDSVRAITPGLPLFLYNYTTHQLHGIFEAASFGGSNIEPTAWEDKKCKGESRFPAQVRIRIRKICNALEEDSFRPVLHHYDGPKFRLELSIPETLDLLDLCKQAGV